MKRIELHTAQRVKKGHENDYCVRDGLKMVTVDFGIGLPRLASKARRLSRHIGDEKVDGYPYAETAELEKGMAAVFLLTSELENNVLMKQTYDFFENGHYARTVKFEYSEGGKVSRTEYTNEQQ